MRYAIVCLLIVLVSTASARATPPSEIAGLDWLTGKTWTSKPAGAVGNVERIETRYVWSSTGNFVQFDTRFVKPDGDVVRRYAGMFYVDPKDGPSVWYMHQDNLVTTGRIDVRPDGMTMNIVETDGTYRVNITRTGEGSYRWELFARDKGAWVKALTLDFAAAP